MRHTIGKYSVQILLTLVLCVIIIFSMIIVSNANKSIAQLSERKVELTEKANALSAEIAKANANIVKESTGLDSVRKMEDDRIATSFFRRVFTWDSYKSYMSARSKGITDFGVPEKGQFFTDVMPAVGTYTVGGYKGSKGDGSYHNTIDDDGLNMEYLHMVSYVIDILPDGTYKYFTEVEVGSADSHKAKSAITMIMSYSVKDGKLLDVYGYTPSSAF